jgi:urease accessory protein
MSLARLLQLASPTLPVGAYSYSQGLEAAVEAGIVRDAASAKAWIADVLEFSVARIEVPVLRLQIEAPTQARNDFFIATRETAELRAETLQMGHSFAKLLMELGVDVPFEQPAFPTSYAAAVRAWHVERQQAVVAYLWSWLENQAMAAVKAVPLGQTAAQKMLLILGERLEPIAAAELDEARWSNFAPGLAFLCARHETQYSRLFRS